MGWLDNLHLQLYGVAKFTREPFCAIMTLLGIEFVRKDISPKEVIGWKR
jgi:hypothetical protein